MKLHDAPIDLPIALERQRAAWSAAPCPSWEERAGRLRRLQRILVEHEAAISQAIDADFGGRPAIETELAEIWPSLEEVKGALRHGRAWMKPRRAGVGKWFQPARAQVLPQPLGVVGIIVPWNYPLYLAIGPLVAALAAGNRAMVKMSEFTPGFSALLQQLCEQAFTPEELCIVTGGPEVAAQFSALPVRPPAVHRLHTGGPQGDGRCSRQPDAGDAGTGRQIARRHHARLPAGPRGGANPRWQVAQCWPNLHCARLRAAAARSLPAFVDAARAHVRRGYPAGLADGNYCSIVNDRQYRRLLGHVDEAAQRGTLTETLFDGAARDDAGHRLAPMLLIDPPADCGAMRDEIFGPVLPLVPYDSVDDAIAFVNARPRPLALYWFDRDNTRVERALQAIPAGGVTVNDTLLHITQESLPFGGVGASGMGHYHGRWGFDTFSKLKPVFRQSRLNGMALFLPPYGPLMRRLLGLMKRF
jgi:coniferyl-aldehyde dehydrogenase